MGLLRKTAQQQLLRLLRGKISRTWVEQKGRKTVNTTNIDTVHVLCRHCIIIKHDVRFLLPEQVTIILRLHLSLQPTEK